MTETTFRRTIIGVCGLLLLYGTVRLGGAFMRPQQETGGALGDAIERIKRDTLVAVTVDDPRGERLELRLAGDHWTVNGFRADSFTAARLAPAVQSLHITGLAAKTAESHAGLGVTTDVAMKVELVARHDSARLLMGTAEDGLETAYLRLPEAPEVYAVAGELRRILNYPVREWRDKDLLRLDTASVRTLVVDRGTQHSVLQRSDTGWRRASGGEVKGARVSDVLAALARFDALGFPDDAMPFTGVQHRRLMVLSDSTDTLSVLDFRGDSAGNNWVARIRGDTHMYEIAGFRVDAVTPADQELSPAR